MDPIKIIVFKEEKEEYGITVDQVVSIEKPGIITPVPRLPAYMKGITDIRDELVPVVDLRKVFYDKDSSDMDRARLIVLKTESFPMALLAEEVMELIDVEKENMKQMGFLAFKETSYFSNVIHQDNRIITLVDSGRLIQSLDGIRQIYEYMEEQRKNVVNP